ncbi:uncharacterized protein TRIREDRAFT_104501, partial [Trichoderma reesei QM6a]
IDERRHWQRQKKGRQSILTFNNLFITIDLINNTRSAVIRRRKLIKRDNKVKFITIKGAVEQNLYTSRLNSAIILKILLLPAVKIRL